VAVPGTVMPAPKYTAYDNNGLPLAGGLLEIYAAGTSTPVQGYADSSLLTPLPNPVVLDAGGRASIFLAPGFYKFIQRTSVEKGATIVWTQDNVSSTHPFAEDFDIEATAGEPLVSGQSVYLSQGLGGLIPGRWYLTDSDIVYASTGAEIIGIAQGTIATGTFGVVRIQGRSAVPGPLTIGASYYIGPTPGTLVTPAPANARLVGIADSATTIVTATGFGAKVFIGAVTIDGPLSVTGKITANSAEITTTLVVGGLATLNGGVQTTTLNATTVNATNGNFTTLGSTPLNAANLFGYVNPGAHRTTHEVGGSDAITGALSLSTISANSGNFGTLNTTPLDAAMLTGTINDARLSINVLKYTGGYPGGTDAFLRADGLFAIPPGGGSGGGAPAVHHASHELGGSDVILGVAWLSQANVFAQGQTIGGDLVLTGNNNIRRSTADGADNGYIFLCGGGSASHTRGGYIGLGGNESPAPGQVNLIAGDVPTGGINFMTGAGLVRVKIHPSGGFSFGGDTSIDPGVNNFRLAGTIILSGNPGIIRAGTADGADNSSVQLNGGGGIEDAERGAWIRVAGNEAASIGGKISIVAGNNPTFGVMDFYTGATVHRGRIHYSGGFSWGDALDPGASAFSVAGVLNLKNPTGQVLIGVAATTGVNYGLIGNGQNALYFGVDSNTGSNFGTGASVATLYSAQAPGIGIMAAHANGSMRFHAGGTTERMRIAYSGGMSFGPSFDGGSGVYRFGSYSPSCTVQLNSNTNGSSALSWLRNGVLDWSIFTWTTAADAMRWQNAAGNNVVELQQPGNMILSGYIQASSLNTPNYVYAGGNATIVGALNVGPAMAPAPELGRAKVKFQMPSVYGFQAALVADYEGARFLSCWNYGGGSTEIGYVGQLSTGLGVGYYTSSDARMKRDRGIAVESDVLRRIIIHDFDWVDAVLPGDHRDRGLFAQEAHEVAPFAIAKGTDDRNDEGRLTTPWAVDYSKFVPDLIVGWQQHEKIIAALLKRIDTLEAKQ